ncbi:LOW QUALITY PROTEIN: cytochrome P450 71AP13-like [Lycium ferocissimum]|uniref:LOW QUALITY PROTEIN: cytochrome P450 71AP13-like n=1 Tax=Lycium ferocissimum TaxID=112874 RepID=UPI00281524A6|nr:LOW QUALITY PROTEIN: cytochrome P450 71AP13-like [Lycium ferocissimum]
MGRCALEITNLRLSHSHPHQLWARLRPVLLHWHWHWHWHRKIMVYRREKQIRWVEYYPDHETTKAILDVVRRLYDDRFYTTCGEIPYDTRQAMLCRWDPTHNERVAVNFEKKGSARLFDWFSTARKHMKKPQWITDGQWEQLKAYWRTPEFIADFEQAKTARASQKGGSLHTAGAKSQGHVARTMDTGQMPTQDELFPKTYTKRRSQSQIRSNGLRTWLGILISFTIDLEHLSAGFEQVLLCWFGAVFMQVWLQQLAAASMSFLQQPEANFQPLVLASIFLLLVLRFLFNKNKKRYTKLPPSPPKLPIIGNLHQLGNAPHKSLHCLAKNLGPIMYLKLGEIPTIVLSSASITKEVIRTHDLAFASRPQIYSAKQLLYNWTDIGFAPCGSYRRQMRKICILELLSTKRVQSFSLIREEEVARLVHRITESYPGTTNLSKTLALYANDVICRVAFGKIFTEGGDYERHGFHKLLDEFQELLGGLSIGDFFPSIECIIQRLTGLKSRLEDTSSRFDQLLDEIVEDHIRSGNEKDHKDIVDVLLEVQQKADLEAPITMENVKAVISNMFAAGTDSTFITLDWAMAELLMNPKAMEIAQTEVRNVEGDRSFVSGSHLPQLNYIKAIIKEVFRLHPPGPLLIPRESTAEITIEGYTIPPKTRFLINAWALGRDPDTWKNPDVFNPDRFIHKDIDFKGQDFELKPLGVGRRICPGIAFASANIELALAQFLHSFDWELPPGIEAKHMDMTEAFGISMPRISPLILIAKLHFPGSELKLDCK